MDSVDPGQPPTQASSSGSKAAKSGVAETTRFLVLLFVLALLLRSLIVAPFSIPSGSMLPRMMIGDYLFVAKWPYGYSRYSFPFGLIPINGRIVSSAPERGDVVVFRAPAGDKDMVKRVIGVPGDIVAIDERGLSINGEYANYSAGDQALVRTLVEQTQQREPTVYREGGVIAEHDLLRMPVPSPREFFGPIRVPEDMFLMLGDNRDNSADSRYIGFVPRRNIVGLTSRVAISFNPENFYLPRSGRYFDPLD